MRFSVFFILLSFLLSSCVSTSAPMQDYHPIEKTALNLHNVFRTKHHAPPLIWDDHLAEYAMRYASHCRFEHSHGPYGENLAEGYSSIQSATQAWYDEVSKYDYTKPQFHPKTGHFTQLVWYSTRSLGCAYADCQGKNGTLGRLWVCEYAPQGNIINPGYFKANVKAPSAL